MPERKFNPNNPETFVYAHDLQKLVLEDGRKLSQLWRKRILSPSTEELSRWISEDGLSVLLSIECKAGFDDILHISLSRILGYPTDQDFQFITKFFFRGDSPIVMQGQVSTQTYQVMHLRQAPPGIDPRIYWAGQIIDDPNKSFHDQRAN